MPVEKEKRPGPHAEGFVSLTGRCAGLAGFDGSCWWYDVSGDSAFPVRSNGKGAKTLMDKGGGERAVRIVQVDRPSTCKSLAF